MRNLMHGLMAAAVALVLGCGAGTEDNLGTSAQELKGTELLTPAPIAESVCLDGTTTAINVTVFSDGSSDSVEVWAATYDATMGTYTLSGDAPLATLYPDKVGDKANYAASMKYATGTISGTDTLALCFIQSGYGGREPKILCQDVVVTSVCTTG